MIAGIELSDKFHEIVGAVHIHSTYSDGTSEIPEISRMGEEAGLDFLIISDHHTLQGKHDGFQRFYGNLLTLIGYETSDNLDHNHFLVFGTDKVCYDLSPSDYTSNVKKSGGMGIIAHPFEKRSPDGVYPPYPWEAWECEDYDGIEIWNQLSEWTDGLTKLNKLYRFIHPLKSLEAPPPEVMKKWDELAQTRKIIGIAGVDAHSFKVKVLNLIKVRVFHYKVTFKSLRNHLLITDKLPKDNIQKAEELVLESLKKGRLFISNNRRGGAQGFSFEAENSNGKYSIGDEAASANTVFKVYSPLDAELNILCNGKVIKSARGKSLECAAIGPGVYRIEAIRDKRPWVITNHIYLN